MTIKIYENQELYFKNCQALRPIISKAYYDHLIKRPKNIIQLVGHPDKDLNYYLDGNIAYQPNAVEYCRSHVDAYINNLSEDNRVYFQPNEQRLVGTSIQMANGLLRHYCYQKHYLKTQASPTFEAPFIYIVGIGTGLHIEMLLEKLNVRNIFISDAYIDMLQTSMEVIDWQAIIDKIHTKGGNIRILLSDDTKNLVNEMVESINQSLHGCSTGGYLHRHYGFANNLDVANEFLDQGVTIQYLMGWAEDEAQHLRNGVANNAYYRQNKHSGNHFLMPRNCTDLQFQKPALVVGSGPSLEKNMAMLKMFREQFVIFSAGTSTRILLANGIKPDFHVVQENTHSEIMVNTEMAQSFDISGITLIHSSTAPNQVVRLFEKTIMVFRDGKAVAPFLAMRWMQFINSGRTSTLMALFVANWLGFGKIYMLGIDLAAHGNVTHSRFSIYNPSGQYSNNVTNEIKLPGNFKAFVYSNNTWLFMLGGFNIVPTYFPNHQFFNASDGARIKGAIPRKLDNAISDFTPHKRNDTIQELMQKLQGDYENILITPEEVIIFLQLFVKKYQHIKDIFKETPYNPDNSFALDILISLKEYTTAVTHSKFNQPYNHLDLHGMINDAYCGSLINFITNYHFVLTQSEAENHADIIEKIRTNFEIGLQLCVAGFLAACYEKNGQSDSEIDEFLTNNPQIAYYYQQYYNYYAIINNEPLQLTAKPIDTNDSMIAQNLVLRVLYDSKYMMRHILDIPNIWFIAAKENIKPWIDYIARHEPHRRQTCPACQSPNIRILHYYPNLNNIHNMTAVYMHKCADCQHVCYPHHDDDQYKNDWNTRDVIFNNHHIMWENIHAPLHLNWLDFNPKDMLERGGMLDKWIQAPSNCLLTHRMLEPYQLLYDIKKFDVAFTHEYLYEIAQNSKFDNKIWLLHNHNTGPLYAALYIEWLAIYHPEPVELLQQCAQYIEPNGRVFLLYHSPNYIEPTYNSPNYHIENQYIWHYFTANSIKTTLERAGFTLEHLADIADNNLFALSAIKN